jgi:hypothetical protein
MAASATFEQIVKAGPTDATLLSGGFVGADGRKYQMIPTGSKSNWRVSVQGGTVRITSGDPNIAALADGFAHPLPRNLLTINSTSQKDTDFFILAGQSPGRTVIVAEDARGRNLDTLVVSVKNVVPKTFMIHRLRNRTMRSNRTTDELVSMLRTVKATYLTQANVVLAQIGVVNDLVVANDYGDPIDMQRRRPIHGNAGETTDFNGDVLTALNKDNLFGRADFHMVGTCQLIGALGTTPDFKNICYVAHTFEQNASIKLEQETTTYAHELGHAFGLRHPGHGITDMMADGNVIGHLNSFIMTADDIDHDLFIAADERSAQFYGPSTAAAVLAFKKKRKIINTSYQKTEDDIVGIMTITALDNELAVFEAQAKLRSDGRCVRGNGPFAPVKKQPKPVVEDGLTLRLLTEKERDEIA